MGLRGRDDEEQSEVGTEDDIAEVTDVSLNNSKAAGSRRYSGVSLRSEATDKSEESKESGSRPESKISHTKEDLEKMMYTFHTGTKVSLFSNDE